MLKFKTELLANVLAGASVVTVLSQASTILTFIVLLTTVVINIKILMDKFKKDQPPT